MTEECEDADLIDLVVSGGDEVAFRALYRRHTPALYRFLLRLTGGDVASAEDLTQDSWLRAAHSLARFEGRSAFRSWLIGIAVNQFRELARRTGRRIVEVEAAFETPAHAFDPNTRLDLERALTLLPAGFRTVLVLHDVEGLTHREIGERLGISDGTCKSQLHEARKAMRRLLTPRPEAG